jgi:thioredoxin 1
MSLLDQILAKKIMNTSKRLFFTLMTGISLLLCTIPFYGTGQAKKTGIRFFSGDWKDALAKAKRENKCIFFDAYASWCGPCKTMDSVVYTDSKVAAYFNKKFISFRIDMEKGEGPDLARKYPSIDGYPSLLFFGSDGRLIKTLLGSRTAPVLIVEAKYALLN